MPNFEGYNPYIPYAEWYAGLDPETYPGWQYVAPPEGTNRDWSDYLEGATPYTQPGDTSADTADTTTPTTTTPSYNPWGGPRYPYVSLPSSPTQWSLPYSPSPWTPTVSTATSETTGEEGEKMGSWAGPIQPGAWPSYAMTSAFPWGGWEQTPWASVPEGRGAEAQTWMNTVLPWYQQQASWQQFAQQFNQNVMQAERQWQMEQAQFAWAQRRLQEEQKHQAIQAQQQRELERELGSMATFGRRWRPQTRWM